MTHENVELSIIMPCLNEAETLAACITKAQRFLESRDIRGEIVIGDNGSTDGSQEIAMGLGSRIVQVQVAGYGAALSGAVSAASGIYCIMGDSDDSYDFENLDGFIERLRAGADLVMGNRFAGGIEPGAMPWKNRYIGNPVLSTIGQVLFRAKTRDFHCGLRGFSKRAFERLDLRTTGMEFASEMVIKATLMGLTVAEVPTTLSPDGRSRPPHLRPYRDGWRHLRFMLLFSPNWLFLYPGLLLALAALLIGSIIIAQPIVLHSVKLGLDTLIYCAAAVSAGFQAILFALLSRSFAMQEGLYPKMSTSSLITERITLESGLITGFLFVLAGLVSALYALLKWEGHSFGLMDVETMARVVIPSSVALSLGFEIILFSLLLSTFALGTRPYAATKVALGLQSPSEIAASAGRSERPVARFSRPW